MCEPNIAKPVSPEYNRMNKVVILTVFLLSTFNSSRADAEQTLIDRLEAKYFSVLDEWVERGGKANEYQSVVLETCGKLVMVSANASEAVAFTTTQREEFDFRVDVCAKTTVNRSHHQSEFDDPKIIQAICDDSKVRLLGKLCKRSGLR
jgi:hypothetical protein